MTKILTIVVNFKLATVGGGKVFSDADLVLQREKSHFCKLKNLLLYPLFSGAYMYTHIFRIHRNIFEEIKYFSGYTRSPKAQKKSSLLQ